MRMHVSRYICHSLEFFSANAAWIRHLTVFGLFMPYKVGALAVSHSTYLALVGFPLQMYTFNMLLKSALVLEFSSTDFTRKFRYLIILEGEIDGRGYDHIVLLWNLIHLFNL